MSASLVPQEQIMKHLKSMHKEMLKPDEPEKPNPYAGFVGILGKDSMSPYDVPSSPSMFKNITDVMNRKGFKANYPQSYTPVPNYFREHGISPFFDQSYDDWARGSLTIAGMIELTSNGQPWQLVDPEKDIDVVMAVAKAYLDAIDNLPGTPALRLYAEKVRNFLNMMEEGRTRMYKRQGKINPHAIDLAAILNRLLMRQNKPVRHKR